MDHLPGWECALVRKTITTLALIIAGAAVAGCTSVGNDVASSPTVVVSPSQSVASSPPTPKPTTTTNTPNGDAAGVATPVPGVSRAGQLPAADKVVATPATYANSVTYSDGLRVRVLKIKQETITAQGPGAMTGMPSTNFTIRFTNDTKRAIDLNQVVVSSFYGKPRVHADPVYGSGQNDFSLLLAPGEAAQAEYAFSVPVAELNRVTLTVDFDGVHQVAVFYGTAKS
jgi:hypothetical protein